MTRERGFDILVRDSVGEVGYIRRSLGFIGGRHGIHSVLCISMFRRDRTSGIKYTTRYHLRGHPSVPIEHICRLARLDVLLRFGIDCEFEVDGQYIINS